MARTDPTSRFSWSRRPASRSVGVATFVLATSLAVSGCAGASGGGSTSSGGHRGSPMTLGSALSAAIERHATNLPFSVERVTIAGRSNVSVGAFDGERPTVVVYAAADGVFVDDRAAPPIDDEEAASLAELRERLASGGTTLRTALRMVESRYMMAEVTGVALLVRSGRLLVRVVTGSGDASVEHYHDAASGERTELPGAGVDAGPVDAGPPDAGPTDAGRDAGARDAGRRR